MSCRIIFVRHGQSLGNLHGTFLGVTDLDLSPLGYIQAECTAKYLKDETIDAVYSSDLLRAYHTSLPVAGPRGIDVIKSTGLREINAGSWENQRFDYLENHFPKTYGLWLTDIGHSYADNGESVSDLQKRIVDTVTEVAETNDGKTVAIFTHATPIRAFFCFANGKGLDDMKFLPWVSNASVSEVIFNNGVFHPVRYGYDSFLKDLKTELPKNC